MRLDIVVRSCQRPGFPTMGKWVQYAAHAPVREPRGAQPTTMPVSRVDRGGELVVAGSRAIR